MSYYDKMTVSNYVNKYSDYTTIVSKNFVYCNMENECRIGIKKVTEGYYRVVCKEHKNVLGIFCDRNGLLDPITLTTVLEDESESILICTDTLQVLDEDDLMTQFRNTKRLYYYSKLNDFKMQSN